MKRFFSMLFSLIFLTGILSSYAHAESLKNEHELHPKNEILISQVEHELADGTYLVITVSQSPDYSRANTRTVSGTKTHSCKNSDGEILWQFVVHGTFSVTEGVSATCTSASHSYRIVNTDWSYVTGSSSRSGNKAIGHGEFKKKILLITVDSRECDVTLTCNANGVLS